MKQKSVQQIRAAKPTWQAYVWDLLVLGFYVGAFHDLALQAIDSGSILSYFLTAVFLVLVLRRVGMIFKKIGLQIAHGRQ